MSSERKVIALHASPEEIRLFELVKAYHKRNSDSDMVRYLIVQEAAKILPRNSPTDKK